MGTAPCQTKTQHRLQIERTLSAKLHLPAWAREEVQKDPEQQKRDGEDSADAGPAHQASVRANAYATGRTACVIGKIPQTESERKPTPGIKALAAPVTAKRSLPDGPVKDIDWESSPGGVDFVATAMRTSHDQGRSESKWTANREFPKF